MGMKHREGILNVVEAVIETLRAAMPALVAAANAESSSTFYTPLGGPWTLAEDMTLILSRNNGADVTGTIAAGAYTPTTLAAAINADDDLSAYWTAEVPTYYTSKVSVYDSTRGEAGQLKVGAGTINATLGLVEGTVYGYEPLEAPKLYRACQEDFDGMFSAYPAISIRADQDFGDTDASGQNVGYDVRGRVYACHQTVSGGNAMPLYSSLSELSRLIVDALTDSPRLGGQVTSIVPRGTRISDVVLVDSVMYRGSADFECHAIVQEELY